MFILLLSHFHFHTFTLSHFHTFSLMISLSHFHFHTFTFILSLSYFHTFTFILSRSHFQFHILRSTWVYLGQLSLFQITIEWFRPLKPISGWDGWDGWDGRLSPSASLLRAPYGANNCVSEMNTSLPGLTISVFTFLWSSC